MKSILLSILSLILFVNISFAGDPDPNPPVIIAPLTSVYHFECDTLSIEVSVTDIEPGPVTLTITGLPPQAVVTPPLPAVGNPVTVRISFVPDFFNGEFHYTATDTSGNIATSFTLFDYPLSILDPPVWGLNCGTTYNLEVEDTITIPLYTFDWSYDILTITATGIPDGAVLDPPLPFTGNPYKGTLKWKPTGTQHGMHTILFRASDHCGRIADCSINFDVVLPVELSSFVSNILGNNVTLNWTTSSETNNLKFEIERKKPDENSWQTKGTIAGSGNSTVPVNYKFTDHSLTKGTYEYRIKQTDFNGNFEYHNLTGEVIIGQPKEFRVSQNYPNPFNPLTKIDFNIPFDGNVVLKVYDINGKEIVTLVNEQRQADYYTEYFSASNLASGVYYYKVSFNSGEVKSEKVLKMMVVK